MALFFDQPWFDQRLKENGFDRAVIAGALGLSPEQVDEIWKDQRELTAAEVATLAKLLQADISEIVNRAGVSTPGPNDPAPSSAVHTNASDIEEIKTRLSRLEDAVAEISALLRAQ